MRAVFAALLLTAPATAADPPAPVLTAQAASFDTLFADVKAVVRAVAGDPVVEMMDESIKEQLGEKLFAGLDTTKPFGGYVYMTAPPGGKKVSQVSEREASMMVRGVLLVPAGKPADFQDFVARLFKRDQVLLTPVEGNDGLYKLDSEQDPAPVPMRVRFAGGYAHLGINLTDDQMDAKALIPADKVIDPKETAQAAVRFHLDRLPADYPAAVLEVFDKGLAELQNRTGEKPSFAETAALDAMKLLRSYLVTVAADGTVSGQRLLFDRATGDMTLEVALAGKPGGKLTAAATARKPTTNRFAGLVTDTTAVGVVGQLPTFDADLRAIIVKALRGFTEAVADEPGMMPKPILLALVSGLRRTVESGQFDLGASVTGPDKDGTFTAAAAVALDGAPALEAAFRDTLRGAPKETQDAITPDADKAGDVSIHKITPPEALPPPVKAIFGGQTLHVAFGPTGIYVAIGPDAVTAIKSMLALKPAEAKALDLTVNPKRVKGLTEATGMPAAMVEQLLGTDDKRRSLVSLGVAGGDKLTVRVMANVRVFGGLVMTVGRYENKQFQAVPVPKKN